MNFLQVILKKFDLHYSPFEITGKVKCVRCGKWFTESERKKHEMC